MKYVDLEVCAPFRRATRRLKCYDKEVVMDVCHPSLSSSSKHEKLVALFMLFRHILGK